MVLKETKGSGVDIVLNSLAEEKLQASLRCLKKGGHFFEIGKFDMAKDNPLNLELVRKGITFHGVMLDVLFNSKMSDQVQLMDLLRKGVNSGYIKPLVRRVFGMDEVETAFRYMAGGKHVGKVLVRIREESKKDCLPSQTLFKGISRYYCDPNGVYVITGGLGGFGLELSNWLVAKGAAKLVLSSRSGIKNGYQASRIR